MHRYRQLQYFKMSIFQAVWKHHLLTVQMLMNLQVQMNQLPKT